MQARRDRLIQHNLAPMRVRVTWHEAGRPDAAEVASTAVRKN